VQIIATNYNDIADDYQKTKDHPVKNYAEAFTFLQVLDDVQAKSILDLACGDGYYTRLIKQQGAARVIGVDISDKMINRARAIEATTPLGIVYQVGDATQLGQIGQFDVVTSVSLFPYASNERTLTAMCQTMYDNLRPGGQMASITLNPQASITGQARYEQYGLRLAAAEPLQDGTTVRVTIEVVDGSIELSTYYWSRETYERILYQVGFVKIMWHAYRISEAGMQAYGAEYWQLFLTSPYTIIIEGYK
jgi:SAM-dependent methyltransferase